MISLRLEEIHMTACYRLVLVQEILLLILQSFNARASQRKDIWIIRKGGGVQGSQ
jgi:hypothetical protein